MHACSSVSMARRDDLTVRITGYTCKAMWLNCAALLQSQTYTVAGAALIIFHVTCLNTKVLLQTVCGLSFRITLHVQQCFAIKVQMFPMQTNITELATQSTKQFYSVMKLT